MPRAIPRLPGSRRPDRPRNPSFAGARWSLAIVVVFLLIPGSSLCAGGVSATVAACDDEEAAREAFRELEAVRKRSVPDPVKFRTDPAYRATLREARKAQVERERMLALRLLDRFEKVLDKEEPEWFLARGVALKSAGNLGAAVGPLRRVSRRSVEPVYRLAGLIEWIEALASVPAPLAEPGARSAERARVRTMRSLLRRVDRAKKPDSWEEKWADRLARVRAAFRESVVRIAFDRLEVDLASKLADIVRASTKGSDDETLVPKTGEAPKKEKAESSTTEPQIDLPPDMLTGDDVSLRERIRRETRKLVGAFYREHRDDLERGAGFLWKARAFRLARDHDRATRAYEAFLDAVVEHDDRSRAALRLAQMLSGDETRVAALLREIDDVDLTEDERRGLAAVRARTERDRAHREAIAALIGKPMPPLTPDEASEKKDTAAANAAALAVGERPTAFVVFATWSAPGRESLLAVQRGIDALTSRGIRVVGVTRRFGFGWRATKLEDGALVGTAAGPDLDAAVEHALLQSLTRAASLTFPLVSVRAAGLDAVPLRAYPTAICVDAKGHVRAVIEGRLDANRLASAFAE